MTVDSPTGNREVRAKLWRVIKPCICSLAYSGTGSLSQSEDFAQETFIAAWKQLANLREHISCARGFAALPGIGFTTR